MFFVQDFRCKRLKLWQDALKERPDDVHQYPREKLRSSYLDLRNRVKDLVSKISKDVPGLTVHDITHLDALWETASLITGDGYPLTPAEAYVLGGAILLHDAAMSLAAYPGGVADLKGQDEWRDTIAQLLRQRGEEELTDKMISNPNADVASDAIPIVLRSLHAKQAADLPLIQWTDSASGTNEYLIQDSELRNHYGKLIGEIAASHWQDVEDLRKLPELCTAGPQLPHEWTVDPWKTACILRVADAAHVDHRRAPLWLKVLEQPTGESLKHWQFQNKLGKPTRQDNALIYTGSGFTEDYAESWWLCFDTIQMIDRELHSVDVFLEELKKKQFAVNHVKAAESPIRLSKLIQTDGWHPVDTRIRISDVPGLVERFGGKQLYGDDPKVVLRELIQNAADAIRAMRCISDTLSYTGIISVTLHNQQENYWLDIQDNGIGMGKGVLTGALLDFGTSLWRSRALQSEHPGLSGRGLNTTGRFGIGFFSVFMLGKHVKVTSRRYDAAVTDMQTLEFAHGLDSRPILRTPAKKEKWHEYGTRVAICLETSPYDKGGLLWAGDKSGSIPLSLLVTSICPSLGVDVHVHEEPNTPAIASKANDWISIPTEEFFSRLVRNLDDQYSGCSNRLRLLKGPDGTVFGRACISTGPWRWSPNPTRGVVTIGGLYSTTLSQIGGILIGSKPETLARDATFPKVPLSVLHDWATEQAQIIDGENLSERERVRSATAIMALGGNPTELPIALMDEEGLNQQKIRELLNDKNEIRVYEDMEIDYEEELDEMHPRQFNDGFEDNPKILFMLSSAPQFLTVGSRQWPMCVEGYDSLPGPKIPLDAFINLIEEVWGKDFDQEEKEYKVGSVDDFYEVTRNVTVFTKLPPSPPINLKLPAPIKPQSESM